MMKDLDRYDVAKVVSSLPGSVFAALQNRECFLAGGFIRSVISGEDVNDIDLFCSSPAISRSVRDSLQGSDLFETENAFSCVVDGVQVQVIHRWTFGNMEECVKSFDFTIAKSAIEYDGHDWRSLCDERFYQDLAAKRLVYTNPDRNEDAGGSMLRLLKFHRRGYSAPLRTVADVMARMAKCVRVEDIHGEITYSDILLGMLREVDPIRSGDSE